MAIYYGSTQAGNIYLGSTAITSLYYGATQANSSGPPLDSTTPIMAYASDRKLLSAYGGSFITTSTGNVTTLFDQTGGGRHFTADISNVTTEVVGTDTALSFGGSSSLVGPLISAVFSTNTWVIMVVDPTTIDQNGNPAGVGGNAPLGDKAEGGNLTFIKNGTANGNGFGVQAVQFHNPSYGVTPDVTAYPSNRMVLQFRKDSTKLYCRVNLGTEVNVSLGAFTATAFNLQLGASLTGHFFKGRIYAMAGYVDANIPADRDTVVSKIMSYYNIPGVPSVTSYPDATTTGTTGTLTPVTGDVTLSTPGQVYQNMNVSGSILVAANNVTINNCKVSSSNFWGIHVQSGVTGCQITHCEVNGLGTGNTIGIAYEPDAINGSIQYCNIYGCEDGIRPSSGSIVKYNYIHDFASLADSGHYDGIELDGGQDTIEIAYNRVINTKGQTSCVQMNNFAGVINNINIHNNYLDGGGYVFYIDGHFTSSVMTNITVSNNVMGRGTNGWAAINWSTLGAGSSGTFVHANNYDVLTGQKVDALF